MWTVCKNSKNTGGRIKVRAKYINGTILFN